MQCIIVIEKQFVFDLCCQSIKIDMKQFELQLFDQIQCLYTRFMYYYNVDQ